MGLASKISTPPCFSTKKSGTLYFRSRLPQSTRAKTLKRAAGVLRHRAFYYFAAVLLNEMKTIHRKVFAAGKSRFENFLSAQMLQTKISVLSVKAMFPNTVNLFFQDWSDRREKLVVRAKGCSELLASVMSMQFLPQQEMVVIEKDGTEALRQ